ncbi:MAG TPA: hypothetical protein VKA94_01520 [Hyphomicrobiales bacterium]|nr:hypothetical protein [Hyphomicrobiales bacterium]
MAARKTLPTPVDPHEFLASVEPARRRQDGAALMEMMGHPTHPGSHPPYLSSRPKRSASRDPIPLSPRQEA